MAKVSQYLMKLSDIINKIDDINLENLFLLFQ